MGEPAPSVPRFQERPTERVVPDAWRLAGPPALLGGMCLLLGWGVAGWTLVGGAAFLVAFFRNPERAIPGDERCVVSPADGIVVDVDEAEADDGSKEPRVAIFLSVFDVHVNRMPLAGRVVDIERSGDRFLAAFDPRASERNVRCTLTLETADAARFRVAQITGLVARRIVCHPEVGEWVERGARYGMIRFGSRAEVVLPPGSVVKVRKGARVKGGSSIVAQLPERAP